MTVLRTLSLLLCLLVAACAPPPPVSKLANKSVVLAFGDSITYGTGASRNANYPKQLEMLINRTVVNAGVPGETSDGAKKRFAATLKQYQPALVIICTGGNDFLRRQNANDTKNNIKHIVRQAKQAGVAVMLVAVPRLFVVPVNHSLYGEIAAEEQLWLEDDVLKNVLFDNKLKSDHVHPNGAGYLLIAQAIANMMKQAGAI